MLEDVGPDATMVKSLGLAILGEENVTLELPTQRSKRGDSVG